MLDGLGRMLVNVLGAGSPSKSSSESVVGPAVEGDDLFRDSSSSGFFSLDGQPDQKTGHWYGRDNLGSDRLDTQGRGRSRFFETPDFPGVLEDKGDGSKILTVAPGINSYLELVDSSLGDGDQMLIESPLGGDYSSSDDPNALLPLTTENLDQLRKRPPNLEGSVPNGYVDPTPTPRPASSKSSSSTGSTSSTSSRVGERSLARSVLQTAKQVVRGMELEVVRQCCSAFKTSEDSISGIPAEAAAEQLAVRNKASLEELTKSKMSDSYISSRIAAFQDVWKKLAYLYNLDVDVAKRLLSKVQGLLEKVHLSELQNIRAQFTSDEIAFLRNLSIACYDRGFKESGELFVILLLLDPTNPIAWNNLGFAERSFGLDYVEVREIATHLRNVTTKEPHSVEAELFSNLVDVTRVTKENALQGNMVHFLRACAEAECPVASYSSSGHNKKALRELYATSILGKEKTWERLGVTKKDHAKATVAIETYLNENQFTEEEAQLVTEKPLPKRSRLPASIASRLVSQPPQAYDTIRDARFKDWCKGHESVLGEKGRQLLYKAIAADDTLPGSAATDSIEKSREFSTKFIQFFAGSTGDKRLPTPPTNPFSSELDEYKMTVKKMLSIVKDGLNSVHRKDREGAAELLQLIDINMLDNIEDKHEFYRCQGKVKLMNVQFNAAVKDFAKIYELERAQSDVTEKGLIITRKVPVSSLGGAIASQKEKEEMGQEAPLERVDWGSSGSSEVTGSTVPIDRVGAALSLLEGALPVVDNNGDDDDFSVSVLRNTEGESNSGSLTLSGHEVSGGSVGGEDPASLSQQVVDFGNPASTTKTRVQALKNALYPNSPSESSGGNVASESSVGSENVNVYEKALDAVLPFMDDQDKEWQVKMKWLQNKVTDVEDKKKLAPLLCLLSLAECKKIAEKLQEKSVLSKEGVETICQQQGVDVRYAEAWCLKENDKLNQDKILMIKNLQNKDGGASPQKQAEYEFLQPFIPICPYTDLFRIQHIYQEKGAKRWLGFLLGVDLTEIVVDPTASPEKQIEDLQKRIAFFQRLQQPIEEKSLIWYRDLPGDQKKVLHSYIAKNSFDQIQEKWEGYVNAFTKDDAGATQEVCFTRIFNPSSSSKA